MRCRARTKVGRSGPGSTRLRERSTVSAVDQPLASTPAGRTYQRSRPRRSRCPMRSPRSTQSSPPGAKAASQMSPGPTRTALRRPPAMLPASSECWVHKAICRASGLAAASRTAAMSKSPGTSSEVGCALTSVGKQTIKSTKPRARTARQRARGDEPFPDVQGRFSSPYLQVGLQAASHGFAASTSPRVQHERLQLVGVWFSEVQLSRPSVRPPTSQNSPRFTRWTAPT